MWHDSLNRGEGRNKIQEGLKHRIKEIGAKNNKFKELAEKRVKNALKQIQLTGNLSNKYSYNYSEEDVNKISYAIDSEIMILKAKFKPSPENKSFKL